jgi:hypothetical protein
MPEKLVTVAGGAMQAHMVLICVVGAAGAGNNNAIPNRGQGLSGDGNHIARVGNVGANLVHFRSCAVSGEVGRETGTLGGDGRSVLDEGIPRGTLDERPSTWPLVDSRGIWCRHLDARDTSGSDMMLGLHSLHRPAAGKLRWQVLPHRHDPTHCVFAGATLGF